jgi:translocation and assembly module TamB
MNLVRRMTHALLLVLMLVVGATAAAIIASQTAWFKNWLRGYIVREAGEYLNGTLTIDRLGGNLFFGLELQNIGVSMDGRQVVAVEDLGLDYSIFELISSGLSVDQIRLNKPTLHLRRDGDTWSIGRLIKREEQEADREGPMRPISIGEIHITDGSVVMDGPVGTSGVALPKRFDRVDATLALEYEPVRYSINVSQVSFRGSEPEIALNAFSGGVSVRDDTMYVESLALRTAETSLTIDGAVEQYLSTPVFAMQISSDRFSLPELARVVPALAGIGLQPAFELDLNGPLDALAVTMNLRSPAGDLAASVTADVAAPGHSAVGTLTVRQLDMAPILKQPAQKTDISGRLRLDVRAASLSDRDSWQGSASVDAPRVAAAGLTLERVRADAGIDGRRVTIDGQLSAYGAAATTEGAIGLPKAGNEPITFDLRGRTRDLDLRRLPPSLEVPPAPTNVNAAYHVTGSTAAGVRRSIDADLTFAASTVAGARIDNGSTALVRLRGDDVTYDVAASVADLDLQQVGSAFRVPALADDRYKTSINGTVKATGRGTSPGDIDVTATGALRDTVILGGRLPEMSFTGGMQQQTAHVSVTGSFEGLDPSVASARPAMKGTIGGRLDGDVTIADVGNITPDRVEGTARITLDPSVVGGLGIDSATIDADYRDSTADIRTLDIVGPDLNVKASGILALNETGQSSLQLHADSPSLERIGLLFERPLAGIASVEATVTGNRRDLQAAGKLSGSGVKYGDTGALSVSSDFKAQVPDLDVQRASVSAATQATFATVADQIINDLDVKTEFSDRQLAFDLTATQPQRSAGAAGSLLMHPDHQEVHLQRLSLTTQGMTWQTEAGSEATIKYGDGTVVVEDFSLMNADQRVMAEGAFGRPGDSLNLTLSNVDVAAIDALLLRAPQFSGRLEATGTLRGTAESPEAAAKFTVTGGGFRQFTYESFGGTVNYTPTTVNLDTRLQQKPDTWIEAKGSVPTALVRGAGATSGEPVDLRIDSTPIDAGIVQGFTTALTGVTGTIEAHVRLTGTAADPQPDGVMTIQNAAFTLEPTGVTYTDLDGRIDLQADRVHIEEIRLLDNRQSPLTLTGDLAFRERTVGEMSIAVKTEDFKVIDNEMGNVRINSDLQLTGQLNAPRLEGDLGVTTGEINLDPILDAFGASAYATSPTELADKPVASGKPGSNDVSEPAPDGAAPGAGFLETVRMDVRLTVPNDLVIGANDLRTPGSPISLGQLNVTLGGDLYVHQVPYDQIRLYGAVNTVRGTYNFQGRRFTILRDGTVRFDGLDDFDPELDIRTERVIQGVVANVNVRGRLKQPEIVLTSTPPLDQADILSLIVFNQPVNQLGTGAQQTLAQRAQALATGAVATQLADSIGGAIGIDLFEISTAPASGAAAELTIGQQVGQNLYVRVQQGVGDQSTTNFILEYELTEWMRLQTSVVQGSETQKQLFRRVEGSGVDLLFFFSY